MATRWTCCLAALIIVVMSAVTCCATVDIAVDLDSRELFGGSMSTEVITLAGFVSWDVTGVYDVGSSSLIEQGVAFTLVPALNASYLFSRHRTSLEGGGGGGVFNDLLTDFAWFDVISPLDAGLLLIIEGLDPGQYRMTSWHFDSFPGVEGQNSIRIAIGDQFEPSETLIESFPIGIPTASYAFEVTDVEQVTGLYYLVRDIGGLSTYRSRLNGFTLVSVPEPSGVALITAAALVGALGVCPRNRTRERGPISKRMRLSLWSARLKSPAEKDVGRSGHFLSELYDEALR